MKIVIVNFRGFRVPTMYFQTVIDWMDTFSLSSNSIFSYDQNSCNARKKFKTNFIELATRNVRMIEN